MILFGLKNYNEFVSYINDNGLPTAICFDHDLGEENTGYDCCKYLIEYALNNAIKNLPLYNIQSANPVGKENIDKLIKNYNKIYEHTK